MLDDRNAVWLATGLRTPFVGVDGPFANRDSLSLSVPVVQAMAPQVNGSIDFAVWGSVVLNLAYANLAREVWLESKLDPHVPTYTTIMQCSTSMVGVFEAAGMLGQQRAALAMVGGVESMSRVQIGLGQNFSLWLRRMFQARSVAERLSTLRRLRPSDKCPRLRTESLAGAWANIRRIWQRLGALAVRSKTSLPWRAIKEPLRRRIEASSMT